jgi:hypothetical protein
MTLDSMWQFAVQMVTDTYSQDASLERAQRRYDEQMPPEDEESDDEPVSRPDRWEDEQCCGRIVERSGW